MTLHSDPSSPIYDFKIPAYNVSKSAVNAWTVQLAYELRDSKVKVNTIHPGYVKTDMNAGEGEIDVPDGAKTSVALALIDDAGPNGSYRYLDNVLPW
jgi:NAD(P)-dependent dehydrogenase (short-subunit alcohol dehydrogenase family)